MLEAWASHRITRAATWAGSAQKNVNLCQTCLSICPTCLPTQPDNGLEIPNPSLAHGQSGLAPVIMSSYKLSNKTIILEPIKYQSYHEIRY